MLNYAAKSAAWDEQVATTARIRLSEDTTAIPLTPLIGAEMSGFDLTEDLSDDALETITHVLTKYKVVMLRSEGRWKMDPEQHTRFCQRISAHWGIEADTPQKKTQRIQGSQRASIFALVERLPPYLAYRLRHRRRSAIQTAQQRGG